MDKKSFRDKFKENYEVRRKWVEENRKKGLEEAERDGGFIAYSVKRIDSRSIPGFDSGVCALIDTIKEISQEKKAKKAELAEKLSGSIKTSDIIIESKTAETAKDEHEAALEETDLDER